jgi:hypothetical protein
MTVRPYRRPAFPAAIPRDLSDLWGGATPRPARPACAARLLEGVGHRPAVTVGQPNGRVACGVHEDERRRVVQRGGSIAVAHAETWADRGRHPATRPSRRRARSDDASSNCDVIPLVAGNITRRRRIRFGSAPAKIINRPLCPFALFRNRPHGTLTSPWKCQRMTCVKSSGGS